MARSNVRIVGRDPRTLCSTVTATILLSTLAGALPQKSGVLNTGGGGAGGGSLPRSSVSLAPTNKLRFPYGVQSFEGREFLKVGSPVTTIPGWQVAGTSGMVSAVIAENLGQARPGTKSKNWLAIDDLGAGLSDGVVTPVLQAPAPWNYSWTFGLQVVSAPTPGSDMPVLAIQHHQGSTFADAWGVRITSSGAELFMTSAWGVESTASLFTFSGPTDIGQWIDLRVVASLSTQKLTAFVDGTEVAKLRIRPSEQTDVTRLRFSYHGDGAGNNASILLDDVGVAFTSSVCEEDLTVDFTTEDDQETALVNGQAITTAPEFGNKMGFAGSGANNGLAIFDSSNPGPNNPSQDLDLLINQGNILILQNDQSPPIVGDVYPRANDDEDGGTIDITFNRPTRPLSVDLIDIDNRAGEGMTLTLTDYSALTRTYTVPIDWTGDLTLAQPGVGTLDLQTLANQAGFASVATAVEDPGFDGNAVMALSIFNGGSGAIDNLHVVIPCVQLTFEVEDDGTPVSSGTAIADGQDLSTPPEFGVEVALTSAGLNAGAATFDSTPGGPNNPGPDLDLLVGLGNILILQSNNSASHTVQTVPGFFDTPNDDVNGGDFFFAFPATVECHEMDLIDVDEEEIDGVTVTLLDSGGKTRVFTCPPSWTEDLLNDGPPGFRTLDLTTLAAQPGFAASATAVEDPGFDADEVVQVTVHMGGAQDMDNFCFCP